MTSINFVENHARLTPFYVLKGVDRLASAQNNYCKRKIFLKQINNESPTK